MNVPANLARINTNNTKAANAFNMGVKNINKTLKMTNLNQKLKNNLVTAQKHFTTAAINASANQPIKAANHARRGIGALKNYIGSNLTNM
jgi:alpha-acetolactate decarboxylase